MPQRNHQPLTPEQAWEMLQFIPADDREDWIKVGMALKSEFGDDGFPLYDDWSRSSIKYNSKSCIMAWRSFR